MSLNVVPQFKATGNGFIITKSLVINLFLNGSADKPLSADYGSPIKGGTRSTVVQASQAQDADPYSIEVEVVLWPVF